MKKILIISITIFIFFILIPKVEMAETNTSSGDEKVFEEQQEKYGISEFLNESSKYLEDIDIKDFFKSSLTGKFDNNKVVKLLSKILGENLKNALITLSSIIVIVIIGSILKSISENLGNETIAKMAYYVQYILIVTLIMANFSSTIVDIKNAVNNLSSFSKILIPLLATLMIASRKYCIIRFIRAYIDIDDNIYIKLYYKCSNTYNFSIDRI